MGSSEIFCCICGCPLQDVDYEALAQDEVEWLESFRVIGRQNFSTGETARFNISQPASLRAGGGTLVDVPNSDGISSELRPLGDYGGWMLFEADDEENVLFPIHDACLFITREVLKWNEAHGRAELSTMEQFYLALTRQYRHNIDKMRDMTYGFASWFGSQGLEWEHGYYGARKFWCQEWECEDGWEWLCTDPIAMQSLTCDLLSCLRPVQEQPFEKTTVKPPLPDLPSRVCLEGLPIEILNQVIFYLPASASLRLHRCSKILASRITLDQSFWRDYLLSGRLVGYLWDLDLNHDQHCQVTRDERLDSRAEWDWRRLAKDLMRDCLARQDTGILDGSLDWSSCLENINTGSETNTIKGPLGLFNRQRIWKIVQDVDRLARDT